MKLVTSKHEESMMESKKITNGPIDQGQARTNKNKQEQAMTSKKRGNKAHLILNGLRLGRKKGERYNPCSFSLGWK